MGAAASHRVRDRVSTSGGGPCSRVRRRVCRALVGHVGKPGHPDEPGSCCAVTTSSFRSGRSEMSEHDWPIFVVGTQRSGTTLLCRMLSAHPSLFIQNELDVRKIFDGEANRHRILERLLSLLELEQGRSLSRLLGDSGKTRWGLKDPELTYHFDELEAFLPDTRIVIIVRDARAVVSSYMKNRWGLGTNAYTGAWRWREEVSRQLEFQRRHPDHVLMLQFEQLLRFPRDELDRVCRFLEMPFDENMLQYDKRPVFFQKGRENSKTFERPRLRGAGQLAAGTFGARTRRGRSRLRPAA